MKRWLWLALAAALPVRAEPPGEGEMGDEYPPVIASTAPAEVSAATAPPPVGLRVVHPPEGAALPFVKSSFVFGSVDPAATLSMNGLTLRVHPGGGWITLVAYQPGANDLRFDVTLGTVTQSMTRRVYVAAPPGVPPVKPLNVRAMAPETDMEVAPGDLVTVTAVGSPGQSAAFTVGGGKKKFPMAESTISKGTYRGSFVVQPGDKWSEAALRVTITSKGGGQTGSTAPGKLWRFDDAAPWVVEVSTDLAILRAAPAPYPGEKAGYVAFPPVGTRLWVTGRRGNELRVRLNAAREAWIGTDEVRFLPAGTPPPKTLAGAITVDGSGRHSVVRLGLGQRVPFEIRPMEGGAGFDILFFGVASNTDWVHYNVPNGAVSRVEWVQDDAETYRLRVHARSRRWWGYDARYENSTFVLELRRPPAPVKGSPLDGVRVVVDAGHSWDTGARGPTGLVEKDANLAIAKCLEQKLLAERAEVVMLRRGSENVALYDRPKLAWAARGDLLVSVHNNALPEGGNPFERNGYGVYFYHPHSQELAQDVHAAYGELFGGGQTFRSTRLRNDGLHYGNLALARTSQMPAVLTESAYVIWPPEEALLRDATFQCDCAEAMVRGVKAYVRRMREGS